MSTPPIKPAHTPRLSVWQSSARATAYQQLHTISAHVATADLHNHPLVLAATAHAQAVESGAGLFDAGRTPDNPDPAVLSQLFFEMANAQLESDTIRENALNEQVRKYSTADIQGWWTCVENYLYYMKQLGDQRLYTSWQGSPQGLQLSVIDYQLPADAVVAILGDWGTGQDDAMQLLTTIMQQHKPTAIIHLGDIYYSGTPMGTPSAPDYPGECQHNFLDIFTQVFDNTLGPNARIPVFTLPGNHEYYSLGTGFYREVLPSINATIPEAQQAASYFCLRTQDGSWQFLGMDTGYNDSDPLTEFDPMNSAPALRDDEITWHRDKMDTFGGTTILLSHHQLFSANNRLNGHLTDAPPNLNTSLQATFAPYLDTSVAAWLWGHEHNLVLFQNNLLGLPKGRLVGCSSYEETTGEQPYAVNFADIPYLDPNNYQLAAENGYYNHGYAIVDFARAIPEDPITISYYQYPSWGGTNPTPPNQPQLIYSEQLIKPKPSIGAPLAYGDALRIRLPGYGYLAPIDTSDTLEYYPTIDPSNSVNITFGGGAGQITDGSIVQIQATEPGVGNDNQLGVWTTNVAYYYTPGFPEQNWIVRKQDKTDPVLHFGEPFALENQCYSGQTLCPLQENGDTYLTTLANNGAFWIAEPPPAGPAIANGETIRLATQLGENWYIIGPGQYQTQFYPMASPEQGVDLHLMGGDGPILHGSIVQIQTSELEAGSYNLLGAWNEPACYYYKPGFHNERWRIWKHMTHSDNVIRRGDIVWLTNPYHNDQWLSLSAQTTPYSLSITPTAGTCYWRIT